VSRAPKHGPSDDPSPSGTAVPFPFHRCAETNAQKAPRLLRIL
jgi:hypothetical protein